ncbi:hypothetical protein Tco_1572560 [Tanacetum coccineum]
MRQRRRHVAAPHWPAASDMAGQWPVNRRSTTAGPPVNGGQQRRSTVATSGQRRSGRVVSGSGSGSPRGVHVAADVDNKPHMGVEPKTYWIEAHDSSYWARA